jgi:hypothetical protein
LGRIFDFPLIDNTRLSKGQRVAVVLTEWTPGAEGGADLALVHFSDSRASLKEKPYYDEIREMLNKSKQMPTAWWRSAS